MEIHSLSSAKSHNGTEIEMPSLALAIGEFHQGRAIIDLFGYLNVVPNSNPLGIKHFVSGISISFKCECHIIMQIQNTENLNPGRFELGTTMS